MVDKMKVMQAEQNKFEPITIVLETEVEAAIMWAALETDIQQLAERDCLDIDISDPAFGKAEMAMYRAFDDIYDAEKGKYAK